MPLVLSDHAREQAMRRGIALDVVTAVADDPGQILPVRPGREIRQSRIDLDGSLFLVRLVVDRGEDIDTVVTVYRTSKIEKYWRPS